jgi:hypothetical protein
VEKLTRYRTRTVTIRTEEYFMAINCIHTTTSWTHIYFQTITMYACNFANCYTNMLRMSSPAHHSLDRRSVFYVWVCSEFTRIISGHSIILTLSANVCIKSVSASAFGLSLSGT